LRELAITKQSRSQRPSSQEERPKGETLGTSLRLPQQLTRRTTMGACQCGYTTDPEKNCNGTHNVVKAVKADLIAKLEAEGFADAAEHLKQK